MEALERIYQSVKQHFTSGSLRVPSVECVNKTISNIKLPPLTKDNVLYYYLPMQGLVSYTTLSISVMNPHLMVRLFPKQDVTNILLLSAGGGAGLWLWARPHLAAASPGRRFSWAFLGGTLWTLGSILLWAVLRNSVSRKPAFGTVLGLVSGAALTNAALDYFHYVEVMFCGEVHLPQEIYSPNSDDEKYDIDI